MAWNGSQNKNEVKSDSKTRPAGNSHHGLIAGLLIVVLGGAVVWWIAGGGKDGADDEGRSVRSSRIAEAEPELADESAAKPVEKEVPFWKLDASKTNGFTEVQLKKWLHENRPKPAYTNDSSRHMPPAKYAIFKYTSENEIAALLTMEPGETLVGTPSYRGFTEDFLKSCDEPIVVEPDDDEFRRELKRAMNETKIELRERMREGEKLEDILSQTRREFQQLAQYKSMLDDEFKKYAQDPEHTDQDVDDFLTAANKMLEAKGIAPLHLGLITKKRLQNFRQLKEGN